MVHTIPSPTCPFCGIAAAYPPTPPSSALQQVPGVHTTTGSEISSKAFLILATPHVLAFLDIMPLSKGHILLTTRNHWEKVGDVGVRVGEEVRFFFFSVSFKYKKTNWIDRLESGFRCFRE